MRRLTELTADRTDGASLTLNACINAWRAQAGHSRATAANYDRAQSELPVHLLATPIGKVKAADVRAVVEHLVATRNVHFARLAHAVISGGLTHAWRMEWIRDNPARRVRIPAQPKRAATTPDAATVARLAEVAAEDPELHAWLLVSAHVGGRRSEILALHWSDIDLDAGSVRIDSALDPVARLGPGMEKTTKTDTARTVAIGAQTTAALQRWRTTFRERALSVGLLPVDDPYVFTTDLAGELPWRPDRGTKRFAQLRDATGITGVRLHDLRHFVATELLSAGVPVKTVAGRLGHTRTHNTADTDGHALPADDLASAAVLEQGLAGQ